MFSKFEFCGYLNLFGIKNWWVLKIYLYSKFAGLRFVGTQKIVGTQMCWHLYSFIDTQILRHSHLWVLKICDDTKFQVSGREYQNICVLCISCEQKHICAFSIYDFCHMCKKHTMRIRLKALSYQLRAK